MRLVRKILLVTLMSHLTTGSLMAAPQGGDVVAGQADISQRNHQTDIQQSSQSAIINWQSFDVSRSEQVQFSVPNQGMTLNRVLSNQASYIDGKVESNGSLFFVNENGLIFGENAQVSAEKLFLSTGKVTDQDFLNQHYAFENAQAEIINRGQLSGQLWVSLIAPKVQNSGQVASTGQVNMIAAQDYVLNYESGSLLSYRIPKQKVDAILSNEGLIVGQAVNLNAKALYSLNNAVINTTGVIEATGITVGKDGVIELTGNDQNAIEIDGALTADQVVVSSQDVLLYDNASISAKGGGVKIGGDWHGKGLIETAERVYIAEGAVIDVSDAEQAGEVVVWSNNQTIFAGQIDASSDQQGGAVEVSSKGYLNFNGQVDLAAEKAGSLLLDPTNITITDGGVDTDLVGTTNNDGSSQTYAFTEKDASDNSTIDASVIETLLTSGTVTLQASEDITINEVINGSTNGSGLTLTANDDILINQNISTNNGAIIMTANNSDNTDDAGIVMANGTTLDAGDAAINLTTANDGDIQLATVTTTGDITLDAAGTIRGSLSANALNIRGASAIGTSGSKLNTDISELNIHDGSSNAITTGDIYINETDGLTADVLTSDGALDLTVSDDATIDVATDGVNKNISVTATGQTLTVNNTVTNGGSTKLVASTVVLENTQAISLKDADISSLQLNGNSGTVDAENAKISVVDFVSNTAAINIENNQGIELKGSSLAAVTVNAAGNIKHTNFSTTDNITLSATGSIEGTLSAVDAVILSAAGIGSVTTDFETTVTNLYIHNNGSSVNTGDIYLKETDTANLEIHSTDGLVDLDLSAADSQVGISTQNNNQTIDATNRTLTINNLQAGNGQAVVTAKQVDFQNTSDVVLNDSTIETAKFTNPSADVSIENNQDLVLAGSADGDIQLDVQGRLSGSLEADTLSITKVSGLGSSTNRLSLTVASLAVHDGNNSPAAITAGDAYLTISTPSGVDKVEAEIMTSNGLIDIQSANIDLTTFSSGTQTITANGSEVTASKMETNNQDISITAPTLVYQEINTGTAEVNINNALISPQSNQQRLIASQLNLDATQGSGGSTWLTKIDVLALNNTAGNLALENNQDLRLQGTDSGDLSVNVTGELNLGTQAGADFNANNLSVNVSEILLGKLTADSLTIEAADQVGTDENNRLETSLANLSIHNNNNSVAVANSIFLENGQSMTLQEVKVSSGDFYLKNTSGDVFVNNAELNKLFLDLNDGLQAASSNSLLTATELHFIQVDGVGDETNVNVSAPEISFGSSATTTGDVHLNSQANVPVAIELKTTDGLIDIVAANDLNATLQSQDKSIDLDVAGDLQITQLEIDNQSSIGEDQITIKNAQTLTEAGSDLLADVLVLQNVNQVGNSTDKFNSNVSRYEMTNVGAAYLENVKAVVVQGSVSGEQVYSANRLTLQNYVQSSGQLSLASTPDELILDDVTLAADFAASAPKIEVLDYENTAGATQLTSTSDMDIGVLNASGQAVTLSAGGKLEALANNKLTANNLLIDSTTQVASSSERLALDVNSFEMHNNQSVMTTSATSFFQALSDLTLQEVQLSEGFDMDASGQTLTIEKLILSNADLSLEAANITFDDVQLGSGDALIKSANVTHDSSSTQRFSANKITFDAAGHLGQNNALKLSVAELSVGATGQVNLDNDQPLSIFSSKPSQLSLLNQGKVTTGSLATSGDITLEVTGDLEIGQVLSDSGDVTLSATGTILDSNTSGNLDVDIQGVHLWLQQANGIGASGVNEGLDINVDSLSLYQQNGQSETQASLGQVFLQEKDSVTLKTAIIDNDFELESVNKVSIEAFESDGSDVAIKVTSDDIAISSLVSKGGDILIESAGDALLEKVSSQTLDKTAAGDIRINSDGDVSVKVVEALAGVDGDVVFDIDGTLKMLDDGSNNQANFTFIELNNIQAPSSYIAGDNVVITTSNVDAEGYSVGSEEVPVAIDAKQINLDNAIGQKNILSISGTLPLVISLTDLTEDQRFQSFTEVVINNLTYGQSVSGIDVQVISAKDITIDQLDIGEGQLKLATNEDILLADADSKVEAQEVVVVKANAIGTEALPFKLAVGQFTVREGLDSEFESFRSEYAFDENGYFGIDQSAYLNFVDREASLSVTQKAEIFVTATEDLVLQKVDTTLFDNNKNLMVESTGAVEVGQINVGSGQVTFEIQGSLLNESEQSLLQANSLLLENASSVASSSNPLNLSVDLLEIHQDNQQSDIDQVHLSNNKALTINEVDMASNLSVAAAGDLLTKTININNQALTLSAGGSITDSDTGSIDADSLSIKAAQGVGSSSNLFNVTINTLSIHSGSNELAQTGDLFIQAEQDLTISKVNTSDDLYLVGLGNLTTDDVNFGSGDLTFVLDGSLNDQGANQFAANSLLIEKVSGIGQANNVYQLDLNQLNIHKDNQTITAGDLYLAEQSSITLDQVLVNGSNLALQVNENLTINQLSTDDGDLNAVVSGNWFSDQVNLDTGNAIINVTGTMSDQGESALFTANQVLLQKSSGIGDTANSLNTKWVSFVAHNNNVETSLGKVFIEEVDDIELVLLRISDDIQVHAGGSIAVTDVSTQQGDVVLKSDSDTTIAKLITSAADVTVEAGDLTAFTANPSQGVGHISVTELTTANGNLTLGAVGNIETKGIDLADGNAVLTAAGNISDVASNALFLANDLLIQAANSVGSETNVFDTELQSLNIHLSQAEASTGDVYLQESSDLEVQTVKMKDQLSIEAEGNLTIDSVEISNDNLLLDIEGFLTLDQVALGEGNGFWQIDGAISGAGGNNLAEMAQLEIVSQNSVGTEAQALQINVNDLTVTVTAKNNQKQPLPLHIQEQDDITLTSIVSDQPVSVQSTGEMNVLKVETENQNVTLQAGENLNITSVDTAGQNNNATVTLSTEKDVVNKGSGIVAENLVISKAVNVGSTDDLSNTGGNRLTTQVSDLAISDVSGSVFWFEHDDASISSWSTESSAKTNANLVAEDLTIFELTSTNQTHLYNLDALSVEGNVTITDASLTVNAANSIGFDSAYTEDARYTVAVTEFINLNTPKIDIATNIETEGLLEFNQTNVLVHALTSEWQAAEHDVNYTLNANLNNVQTFTLDVAALELTDTGIISEANQLFKHLIIKSDETLSSKIDQLMAQQITIESNEMTVEEDLLITSESDNSISATNWRNDAIVASNQTLNLAVEEEAFIHDNMVVQGDLNYQGGDATTWLKSNLYAETIDMNTQTYLESDTIQLITTADALPQDLALSLADSGGEVRLDGTVDTAPDFQLGSMQVISGTADAVLDADFGLENPVYLLDVTTKGDQLGEGRKVVTKTSRNGVSVTTNKAAELVVSSTMTTQVLQPAQVVAEEKKLTIENRNHNNEVIAEQTFENRFVFDAASLSISDQLGESITIPSVLFDFGQTMNVFMFME